MKPTPTEIALIVATLSKGDHVDPCSKLPKAIEMWTTAEQLLDAHVHQFWLESIAPKDDNDYNPIPFESRLEQLMPDISRRSFRLKTFHEYLCEKIHKTCTAAARARGTIFDASELETLTLQEETRLKMDGCSEKAFDDFPAWRSTQLSAKRSAAGRKGAEKKVANKNAKAESKKRKKLKPKLHYVGDNAKLDSIAHPSPKKPTRFLPE